MDRRSTLVVAGVVAALAAGVVAVAQWWPGPAPRPPEVVAVQVDRPAPRLVVDPAPARTLEPYVGHGTWVDVFDYSPPYAGEDPPVVPADVTEMAAAGVATLFLQGARLDDRTPDGLEDPWLLAEWLLRAEAAGVDVVAWYLPEWEPDADLDRLVRLADFEVLGRRFHGVGVDIEWTADDLDPAERGDRLVALSAALDEAVGDDPLGAIVLPPVLIEVVNEQFWPGFPWARIAPHYDVWLPMSYWSFRSERSGYGDGYAYHEESVRRLRENLGDPAALVHGIGGIGGVDGVDDPPDPPEPLATLAELEAFARSLVDSGSIGGSVYDWATLEPAARELMTELFSAGPAAALRPLPAP